jgi:hypothetical protein
MNSHICSIAYEEINNAIKCISERNLTPIDKYTLTISGELQMKVHVLKTDGTYTESNIYNRNDLLALLDASYVEILEVAVGDKMISCAIDEEGQLRELPPNPHIRIEHPKTEIPPNAIVLGKPLPYICGDIVLLPKGYRDVLYSESTEEDEDAENLGDMD